MTSLYAEYIAERTDDKIIEIPEGFATYRYLNDDEIYIIDIFVKKECRRFGFARDMAEMICLEAKTAGCKRLVGTVIPSCKNASDSLKTLLNFGMTLVSSSENVIILKKGI